jgi:hypothetical protein
MRIAGAIDPLVMVPDHGRQLRVSQLRDHGGAVPGMSLDDLELLVCEAARLGENGARSVQLAYVVQRGREPNLVACLLGQLQCSSHHVGVASHTIAMPMGIGISCLESAGELLEDPRVVLGA